MIESEFDCAWAAGLFEGEGCFTAHKYKGPSRADGTGQRRGFVVMEASLYMTDKDVMERFAEIVGRGRVRPKPTPNHKPHWKPQWAWSIHDTDAEALYYRLLPYLGERRKARGAEIIEQARESRRLLAHPSDQAPTRQGSRMSAPAHILNVWPLFQQTG